MMIPWRSDECIDFLKISLKFSCGILATISIHWHTISYTCLKYTIWEIWTYEYTCKTKTVIEIMNIFTPTKIALCPFVTSFLLLFRWYTLSLWIRLHLLEFYINEITHYVLFFVWLFSFVYLIHPSSKYAQSIPFYCWGVFSYKERPHGCGSWSCSTIYIVSMVLHLILNI